MQFCSDISHVFDSHNGMFLVSSFVFLFLSLVKRPQRISIVNVFISRGNAFYLFISPGWSGIEFPWNTREINPLRLWACVCKQEHKWWMMMSEESFKFCGGWKRKKVQQEIFGFFIHGTKMYIRWNGREMDEKSIWRESFQIHLPLGNENDEQSLSMYINKRKLQWM